MTKKTDFNFFGLTDGQNYTHEGLLNILLEETTGLGKVAVRYVLSLIIILLLALPVKELQAQSKGRLLENVTVKSEIAPGEKHQYKVKLAKDQFGFFRLLQELQRQNLVTNIVTSEKKLGGRNSIIFETNIAGSQFAVGQSPDGGRQVPTPAEKNRVIPKPRLQMESFAGYSFNKAHSASFAVESYMSLYLKTYLPLAFRQSCRISLLRSYNLVNNSLAVFIKT